MIRKKHEVSPVVYENCHDGAGALECLQMLSSVDSEYGILLFHIDTLPPETSIGKHLHEGNEEIYYLIDGECTLEYDDEEMPMSSGDISIVQSGHSHALYNTGKTDAKLMVIAVTGK